MPALSPVVSRRPASRSLDVRMAAAEAGLRHDALRRFDALALLEAAVSRSASALDAAHGAAFVAPGDAADGWVRVAMWPATAPADLAEVPPATLGLPAEAPVRLPDGVLCPEWPSPLVLPVGGAAEGAIVLCRTEPWTETEVAAAGRLAALFSTLWAWTEAEARFQRAVADLDECLFTFRPEADGGRRYAFVTLQAEALTGLDADALLAGDADWGLLVAPDDRPAWQAHADRLDAGESSRVTVRLTRLDGQSVWVSERATPGLDAAGLPSVSGVLQDVTAEKEAEATLERAHRVAERAAATRMAFLRLMSHELRTPLGTIRGFAELLADEVAAIEAAPPEATEFAGTIRDAAERALHLVDSLLDLSRLETGGLELAARPVDLASIAHAVGARWADRAAPGVELAVHAPAEAVALGDAARIESVVDALVDNAVAFTTDGAVVVSASARHGRAVVRVRDTGPGMAADFAEALFEPFAQEDTRLVRGHEGAGLSLAIAHRVVAQMGGTLTVETAPGAGATFTVDLPAA